MKKLLLTLFALLFFSTVAYGVNTTVIGANCITITGLDADWVGTDEDVIYEIDVQAIVFIPGTTDDRMVVHDGGIDLSAIFDTGKCADAYDTRVMYYAPGTMIDPVIDISDCTLDAGTVADAVIKIYFR